MMEKMKVNVKKEFAPIKVGFTITSKDELMYFTTILGMDEDEVRDHQKKQSITNRDFEEVDLFYDLWAALDKIADTVEN